MICSDARRAALCDHVEVEDAIARGDLADPRVEHWYATREPAGRRQVGRCLCGDLLWTDRAPRGPVSPTLTTPSAIDRAIELARADRQVAQDLAEVEARLRGRVGLAVFAQNADPASIAARVAVYEQLRALGWSAPRIGRACSRSRNTVRRLLRVATTRRATAATA